MNEQSLSAHVYDVVVIGAGAAGVGVGVALKDAGIENVAILERFAVGASFLLWPDETRFITPSFPTNSIGMLDINAIAIGTSPAFMLEMEHPTGKAYAVHLNAVAEHHELPIQDQVKVGDITRVGDEFRVQTDKETVRAKHVIWAAGEFQYPALLGFEGSELCRHTATVTSYAGLEGDDFIVVGGYESGIDAAYHLATRGKRALVFDRACPWERSTSDPSVALSTYSLERMRDPRFAEHVKLVPNTSIESVAQSNGVYEVAIEGGQRFRTTTQPLLANGFVGSHKKVAHLFEAREDGYPLLNDHDESTITPGLFLCGPSVRHDDHVFCFIFKYRQRFAVVAKAIATSLGLPAEGLEVYRAWGMYLDDLSCCGEECVC